jgi:hypothetical protein
MNPVSREWHDLPICYIKAHHHQNPEIKRLAWVVKNNSFIQKDMLYSIHFIIKGCLDVYRVVLSLGIRHLIQKSFFRTKRDFYKISRGAEI